MRTSNVYDVATRDPAIVEDRIGTVMTDSMTIIYIQGDPSRGTEANRVADEIALATGLHIMGEPSSPSAMLAIARQNRGIIVQQYEPPSEGIAPHVTQLVNLWTTARCEDAPWASLRNEVESGIDMDWRSPRVYGACDGTKCREPECL